MTLRIAQLANFVSPVSGGLKVAVDQIGQGYVRAGHERLLLIPGRRDAVTENEHGVLATIASPRVPNGYRMVTRPLKVHEILRKFKPSSIECSDKSTMLAGARWANRAQIGTMLLSHEQLGDMSTDYLGGHVDLNPLVRRWDHHLAGIFDEIVVTSEYSAGEWRGVREDVRLVPLGVDLRTFQPRAGRPPTSGPIQLCYVGRMSREKYPQLAVAAAVELHERGHDFELHMYGKGDDEERLKKLAGRAPVHFHGYLQGRSDVARAYARSHISLSVCPTETFGLAVLEALACGTPVVTSDRGGAHEVVDESCGESGPPTAEGIADAIERLLPRLGDGLRIAARKRAERFSWDACVTKMLAIHTELADKKS